MRGIAGARLSPGNQKGQRNSRSGDYRLASIELQGTGAGIPEVGGGAWEQSHPRRAGSERTIRTLSNPAFLVMAAYQSSSSLV